MHEGMRSRDVWLPAGETWIDFYTQERFEGGQILHHSSPLDQIPVFIREKGKYRQSLPV